MLHACVPRSRIDPTVLFAWNVLCTFLYTSAQLAANFMQLVGRPKLARYGAGTATVRLRWGYQRGTAGHAR